jgi:glycosyltransferase involved in cell wall biosynthesis
MTKLPRHVFFFIDSSDFGGAEKALLTLIRGLDRELWSPSLIFHPTAALEPLLEGSAAASCELIPVPVMPEGRAGAGRAVSFTRMLRGRRPDVFHAHLTWPLACKFGLAAAVASRTPAVLATHQLIPPFTLTRRAWFQQRLLGSAVGRRIAVSEDTSQRLQDLFGWPREKIAVVHNGVPLPPKPVPVDPDLRAELVHEDRAVLLVPARLDPLKGHEILFEAVRSLERVQVILAGDGQERTRLERLADELGLSARVTFLGFRDDMPRLLACADVVVLPSLREGLPLALLEAMATGKPVVATAIGGTDEAVEDGITGFLVPPGDAGALAAAVERALDDPAEAQRRAAAGAERVASLFTADQMVKRTEALYEELLGSGSRRAASPA